MFPHVLAYSHDWYDLRKQGVLIYASALDGFVLNF